MIYKIFFYTYSWMYREDGTYDESSVCVAVKRPEGENIVLLGEGESTMRAFTRQEAVEQRLQSIEDSVKAAQAEYSRKMEHLGLLRDRLLSLTHQEDYIGVED